MHQIGGLIDQFVAADVHMDIAGRPIDTQAVPDEDGVGRPRRQLNLREFALLKQPRSSTFVLAWPAGQVVSLFMFPLDVVHEPLVKAVASDQIIAEILNLHERAVLEAAQGKVEGASSPVKDEHHLVTQSRELPVEVSLRAKMAVERGEWLMYELVHPNPGGTGRFPQLLSASTREMDGDGQYRPLELATGQAARSSVLPDVAEDLGDNLRGLERPSRYGNRLTRSEVSFRGSHDVTHDSPGPIRQAGLRVIAYNALRAVVLNYGRVRTLPAVKERDDSVPFHVCRKAVRGPEV